MFAVVVELYERNRTLCLVAAANLGLAVVYTGLMAVDGRTLFGRNVWTKPWKFATSIAIFTATMAWLLPSLSLPARVERLVTYTVGGAMTIEITLISTQAARGVASHYNQATTLDATIFAIMGVAITLSSIAVAYVLWRVIRDPPPLPAAYLWGIGLGLFVFVAASFQGWLMIAYDGHAIGAPADGAGLPLVNWSLTGGDLRVAHFVGLHGLQVLPLTGYYASRLAGGSSRRALGAVAAVGGAYLFVTGATFVQALRGVPIVRSVVAPTAPASAVAAALLVCTGAGTLLLAAQWRRHGGRG